MPYGPNRRLALVGLAGALPACSPLSTFDGIVGRDEGVTVAARDVAYGEGPRRRLDVYAPPAAARAAGRAPVLMFFYGGSWRSGRRQDYAFAASAFASRGFLVVVPDYRLVPEVRFPGFLEDGAAAVRWAVDNAAAYGGDPRRIVLAGHSAGAYNAVMLALDRRYLAAAGVQAGRVRGVAGLSGPYDFLPLDGEVTVTTFGNAPDLAQTQPVTFARAGAPPAILVTGDADTTVRPRNTTSLAARLRAVGARVETRVYPGLSHAGTVLDLAGPLRGRAPVLDDVAGFLARAAGARG